MKTALVIFNGVQLHDYQVDHAIDWAVRNKGNLHGLFVRSDTEPGEGYIFPSDIDPAEDLYNKNDAEKVNVNVIHTQIRLFTDMAKAKNVPVQTSELVDPSLKDVVKVTADADILFIDEDYNKSFILASTSFESKDLVKASRCPVEMIRAKGGAFTKS